MMGRLEDDGDAIEAILEPVGWPLNNRPVTVIKRSPFSSNRGPHEFKWAQYMRYIDVDDWVEAGSAGSGQRLPAGSSSRGREGEQLTSH